ncbi:MAG: diguanylate cyclase [Sulfuritalea sp.]|jgi:diguanylate cyclase (GGDEF)-like protein|nr:diguanylate cyclase [Sulfuritalea sp.]
MTSATTQLVSDPAVLRRLEEIKAMDDFPVAKGSAMALIRLTQRESTPLAVLAHALKADPTFSVRLIKVANGVSSNEHRPVVSVRDAISVLGVPAVRALALGFSLLSNHRSGNCANFDYSRFWSHSLARAVALQLATGATQRSEAEEAFSVGLLARVGELVLAELFAVQYAELLQRRGQEPTHRLIDLEQRAFGISHNVLTASLLLDCGLPEDCVDSGQFFEGCEEQRLQEGSTQFVTRHLLALADRIADVCVAPQAEWRKLMPRLFQLGARLGFDAAALIAICDRAAHEWREWGPALEIDAGPMPRFEDVPPEPAAPPKMAEPVAPQKRTADQAAPPKKASQAAPPPRADSGQGMSILVVGDQERARKQLCAVLTAAGHSVSEAAGGRQGLAMALELRPQIMLVDLQAGEMDGIQLTDSLRQFAAGRSIYILLLTGTNLLTGTDDDEKLVKAFEAGVDDFLIMPITPRVLAARLRAGQRVVRLQEELVRDQEEIRRISAALSATNQQLREVGTTDMLTGCPNRRYAMDRLQQEWAMATRSQRPLACMVINIDNFKQVNDSYGHDAGDTVLKLVAGALKDEMRAQDVLARTGGDEFMVICPDTTLDAALACAERIRAMIETVPLVSAAQYVRGSVSVGVAVRDAATGDPDALIRLADQSAYLAKRRRNAVATVQSISPASVRSA